MTQFTNFLKPIVFTTGLILTPTGYAIDYLYDDLNRLIQVTYPTGQIIHYTYDATGNLLSVIQTDSQTQNLDTSHQVAEVSSIVEEDTRME